MIVPYPCGPNYTTLSVAGQRAYVDMLRVRVFETLGREGDLTGLAWAPYERERRRALEAK